jgi:hypothetical protein
VSYRRLLGAWLVLAFAMPLNGAFRELVMKPRLDAPVAEAVSALLGILIVLGVTRWIFRIPAETSARHLAAVSAVFVLLTVAFETVFALVEGQSLATILDHYAFWKGEWWPLVLLVIAATPFIWRGRRGESLD